MGWNREATWRQAVQIEQQIREKYKTLPGHIYPPVQEVTGVWVVMVSIKLNKPVAGALLPSLQYWDLRQYSPALARRAVGVARV